MTGFYLKNAFVLITALSLAACGNDSSKLPSPEQQARFNALRDTIKRELGDQYSQPVPEASASELQRGQELYSTLCAACHGGRGHGNGKAVQEGLAGRPTDLTEPQQARFFSEAARLYIIKKGIPGTPMMGWEHVLTEEDLMSVYKYTRSLIQENSK